LEKGAQEQQFDVCRWQKEAGQWGGGRLKVEVGDAEIPDLT
jgi:hypothetical protein